MKVPKNVASAGVDVHYKFSTVAFVSDSGRTVERWRLDHPDRAALAEMLAYWPEVPTVMEASFGWGWLSDLMAERGIDVHLSNCGKVDQMRKARGWVKTNNKDADLLGLLPMEVTNWWEVWRAPAAVRDHREWMRHRADLVELQTMTKNRIHSIFHRHGIFYDFSDLFGGGGRAFLTELAAGRDRQSAYLSAGAMEALRGDLRVLETLRGELARIAVALRKELERTELVRWLISVSGFGLILAHVVAAEVGELGRFRSSRALASYSLLAPRSFDTGDPTPGRAPLGRHLGQRGNRTLKWAFIEAAHGAVRHGGGGGRFSIGSPRGANTTAARGTSPWRGVWWTWCTQCGGTAGGSRKRFPPERCHKRARADCRSVPRSNHRSRRAEAVVLVRERVGPVALWSWRVNPRQGTSS